MAVALALAPRVSATDFTVPETGKVYRIWNVMHDGYFMYENASTHTTLTKNSKSSGSYEDLYLIEQVSGTENGYTLRNVSTGRYVGSVSANETPYPTQKGSGATFIIKQNSTSPSSNPYYNLLHSDNQSFCMHQASGQRVVRWYPTTGTASASEWRFENVDFTEAMRAAMENATEMTTGVYRIVNDQRHAGADWYAYVDANHRLHIQATKKPTGADSLANSFLVQKQDDGTFTIQSLRDGRYVQKVSGANQIYTTGEKPYGFGIQQQSQVASQGIYWNIVNDPSKSDEDWAWHADAQNNIVYWHPLTEGSKKGLSPTEWRFEPDSTLTNEQVRQMLAKITGDTKPEIGKTYRIFNKKYDRALYDNYTAGTLGTETTVPTDQLEVWLIEKCSSQNKINLRNAVTGRYVAVNNVAGRLTPLTTIRPAGYQARQNTSDPYATVFELVSSTRHSMQCDANNSYNVVDRYDRDNEANHWIFREVTLDSALLARQQELYKDRSELIKNRTVHESDFVKYFSDAACTTLKADLQALSDAEIKTRMAADSLPLMLQRIVLKIKNQSWKKYKSGENWEQRFRIATFKPYADVSDYTWSNNMGIGYLFGNLTGPTGITAMRDSTLFIFVSQVPAGSTVGAELVPMGSRSGTVYTLKQGMNTIVTQSESNVNLRYWVNTNSTFSGESEPRKLSYYPDITVHIEGGGVNGYFDRRNNRDDNETWKKMYDDSLAWAQAFSAISEYISFHMPSSAYRTGGGNYEHMADLIDMWNCIVKDEQALMGFREDYKERFNGVLNATGVDHGYMYASTSGAYFNYNTLGEVLSYNRIAQRDGFWWGPAHEFGHNHQQLFNMTGMTEISNNVFSNQVLFKNGRVNSRSGWGSYTDIDGTTHSNIAESKISRLADNFARKMDWIDYGIWACTQMMYKLYMYYHAAGNDTTFYSRVFHLLKNDRMTGQKTDHCTGATDYLKFALKCCEAAGEDLTDVFAAWGFFHPVESRVIGDYGNTTIYTTQEMIDETLKKMHSYPKKASHNMLFIDDHIRATPAIYPGHQEGEMRTAYASELDYGKMGDVGNWDQFCPDSQGTARVKLVSRRRVRNKISYSTQSLNNKLVGFKVYDMNNKLVYFANTYRFEVPAGVVEYAAGGEVYVMACGSDGTETPLEGETTAISHTSLDADTNAPVDVYSVSGLRLRHKVERAKATEGLPAGIYIVGKEKVIVK